MIESIVINGDEVISYVSVMYKHIYHFYEELKKMSLMRKNLVWESENKKKLLTMYDDMIMEFMKFANNMVEYIEFLEKYVDGYEEVLEEIKHEFKKLDIEDIEGIYERR